MLFKLAGENTSSGPLEGMVRGREDLIGVAFEISTVGIPDEAKLLLKGEGATSSTGSAGYKRVDFLVCLVLAGDAGHTGCLSSLPGLPMSISNVVG